MPFLNDDEFADLNEKLDYAKRELNKANLKLYHTNQQLDRATQQLNADNSGLEESSSKITKIEQELSNTKFQLENANRANYDSNKVRNELADTKLKLDKAYEQLNESNLELNKIKQEVNNTNAVPDDTIIQELNAANRLLNESNSELNKVKEELNEAHLKLNNTEEEDTTVIVSNDEELKKVEKSKTTQNIILSILTGIALALAYYFYGNGSTQDININEIKQLEATRVIDSIGSLHTNATNSNTSFDENIQSLKNNISGKKIYSVQIGAFTKNRYTLLSETLAGISSTGDLFKYSIGLFETLQEAQNFRRELVKVGFRDAFVASYIDGIRQEIEHPN